MKIKTIKIENIKPYENNPRQNDEAAERLKESIEKFGFRVPLLIDKDLVIVAGHTRYKAAKLLGMKELPCIEIEGLSEDEIKAFRIADNKYAEMSNWDFTKLAEEVKALDNISFPTEFLGFSENELGNILSGLEFEPSCMDYNASDSKPKDLVNQDNNGDGQEFEDDENALNYNYEPKHNQPQYVPTGKDVSLNDCLDTSKNDELTARIMAEKDIGEDERNFLLAAAKRHLKFTYSNIAEYYASKASPAMQRLMEDSALVIIDYNDAIAKGYVKLNKELNKLVQTEIELGNNLEE